MLSNYLYNLCRLITSYFKYSDFKDSASFSSFVNFDIYENIITKNNFHYIWKKKLHHSYNEFSFSYNYKILEQYNNLLKVKLTILTSFFTNSSDKNIKSASIDDYLIIIECSKKSLYNTLVLISREENEFYYNKYALNNLASISDFDCKTLTSNNTIWWKEKTKNITKLLDNFNKSIEKLSYDRSSSSKFNIQNACAYAEKFALIPNAEYKNFDDSGGDCTNFISQVLHAGGISLTTAWKPYTHPWLRVEELYNYMVKNNLGRKLPDESPYKTGSVIQFFTPKKGHYFHSGFITYVLPFNEALYCCHSYNKLNYPLSQIYPVIYPVIRCIALN